MTLIARELQATADDTARRDAVDRINRRKAEQDEQKAIAEVAKDRLDAAMYASLPTGTIIELGRGVIAVVGAKPGEGLTPAELTPKEKVLFDIVEKKLDAAAVDEIVDKLIAEMKAKAEAAKAPAAATPHIPAAHVTPGARADTPAAAPAVAPLAAMPPALAGLEPDRSVLVVEEALATRVLGDRAREILQVVAALDPAHPIAQRAHALTLATAIAKGVSAKAVEGELHLRNFAIQTKDPQVNALFLEHVGDFLRKFGAEPHQHPPHSVGAHVHARLVELGHFSSPEKVKQVLAAAADTPPIPKALAHYTPPSPEVQAALMKGFAAGLAAAAA